MSALSEWVVPLPLHQIAVYSQYYAFLLPSLLPKIEKVLYQVSKFLLFDSLLIFSSVLELSLLSLGFLTPASSMPLVNEVETEIIDTNVPLLFKVASRWLSRFEARLSWR